MHILSPVLQTLSDAEQAAAALSQALESANESRNIVLVVVVVLAVMFVLVYYRKTESKQDEGANQNMGDLIKYLGKISELTDYIRKNKSDDDELKNKLSLAINGLSAALTDFKKQTVDHQKLLDGSISIFRTSVDELIKQTGERHDELSGKIGAVLTFVEQQPGQHMETVRLLKIILQAIENARTGSEGTQQ